MLSDKIKYYEETGQKLGNTPAQYKVEFEWLKEVDSLALANAQMNLQKAYNNFFRSPNVGFPKFKSKHRNTNSYTTNNQKSSVAIENGCIKLPKIGLVKLKQHRIIPSDYKLKSVTITQTSSGNYYASVLFKYENQVPEIQLKNFLGLDFSMHELYKDSDGNEPQYPRYYREAEKRLKREQRKLSNMKKGSKNRDKQRVKVARIHEKVANQRKDFLHKQSRQITNTYDCVCIKREPTVCNLREEAPTSLGGGGCHLIYSIVTHVSSLKISNFNKETKENRIQAYFKNFRRNCYGQTR